MSGVYNGLLKWIREEGFASEARSIGIVTVS